MTSTQLPDLQRGFAPDISKPVQNGEPCRQGHELFRPNMRDKDFVISPSTMINTIFCAFMAVLDNLFNNYLRVVCAVFEGVWKRGGASQQRPAAPEGKF